MQTDSQNSATGSVLGVPQGSCRELEDPSTHSLHSEVAHLYQRLWAEQDGPCRRGCSPCRLRWEECWAVPPHRLLCSRELLCSCCSIAVAPLPLWCQGPNKPETSFKLSEVAPSCVLGECETPGGLCLFLGF